MEATLLAIRSIGAEFANRLFYPVVILATVAAAVLVGLVVWLASLSAYWLLLLFPVIVAICIALGVFIVFKLTIRTVTPDQTKAQKSATKQFVDKLQRVADVSGTPKFILLFRIVRDIAAPRKDGFIASLVTDATSLKSDFSAIKSSFKN